MTPFIRRAVLGVLIFSGGGFAAANEGRAASEAQSAKDTKGAPSTAEVLGKLHASNVEEWRMGKLAEERGQSAEVRAFGKTLVTDHDAADAKVAKLAEEEGITLAAHTPALPTDTRLPTGAGFDAAFAKRMLTAHEKAIADVTAARDATNDEKLKSLLGEILPVLEKHERLAQKLVDQGPKA